MEATDILATIDSAPGSRFDPVRIAQDVPEDTARIVSESSDQLPGVRVVGRDAARISRRPAVGPHPRLHRARSTGAPTRGFARQGYLADDLLGKTGVESTFESELRGTYGSQEVERDATGRDIQVLRTTQDADSGRVAHADDRQDDPARGDAGAQVGR